EILQAIAGITAHDAPGNIGVSYRGFGGSSLSQLFNGIHVQYSIAARPVDSWIYDRVEAIGGASSFLYGAGGVGGTINYLTKLPERHDFSEGRLRLGSDDLKEASVGLNRRLAEGQFFRLDLNHKDGGSWTDGTHSRATQLATSLLSDMGSGLRHTLAYEYQTETVDRPYWGTPLRNPATGRLGIDEGTRLKNYNSADGLYAQRVQWLRSITDWRVNDALQFKNTFYAYDALRDYRNVESYRFNADNGAVIRSAALLQRHDQRMVGNRSEASYQGQLLGRRSDWAFGLELSLNRQTRFPNSLSATVGTVNPYAFDTERFFDIPGMAPGFRPDRDNRIETTALYAENRTALTPALHLLTALRHERIALELTNRREVTAASPAAFARSYQPTTGRIGVVWDVAPGANLYAQYATAADPPSGVLSTAS
ncbi:MAG: TonB-dependent receptor, partial [Comamonas sp.]